MEGDMPRGGAPRFEKLDEDYTTWSSYCKAYLKAKGAWPTVATPRPVRRVLVGDATSEEKEAAKREDDKAIATWDRND